MCCLICHRDLPLTKHHLIPVSRHKNKKTIRRHSKEKLGETIDVCRECHNQLHATLNEKEMDENYYSFELLCQHPEINKFMTWIRKHQPRGKVTVKRNKSRRR